MKVFLIVFIALIFSALGYLIFSALGYLIFDGFLDKKGLNRGSLFPDNQGNITFRGSLNSLPNIAKALTKEQNDDAFIVIEEI